MVKAKKPYMLKRWRLGPPGSAEFFFTCARPGRNTSKDKPVDDSTVHAWILGLPGPETAIVSLLGRKPDGTSEFSFYSFYGGYDKPSTKEAYSFQKWIDKSHSDLHILISEHPTCDFIKIPDDTLAAAESSVRKFLGLHRTVIVIDSGGHTRTATLCRFLQAVEDNFQS